MQLNASKTKYIIFCTKNKQIDPQACSVVYNSTEIGLPDDPALITPIERNSFDSPEKSFSYSAYSLMNFLVLNHMLICSVVKSQNHYSVLIELKTL